MPVPANIQFDNQVFDFAFHPTEDIVTAGLITGHIESYRYGLEENENLWKQRLTKKSIRGLEYNIDGSVLYSISKDKSISAIDSSTGATKLKLTDAHEQPLNSLLVLNENMLATGDDQGVIKLWDNRSQKCVMTYTEHDDFIADMTYQKEKKTLIAVGGDGFLSTWDIRKPNVAAMSDCMDDELLSVELVKNGKKAVVGSQDGVLSLWTYGDWGDYSDRFLGHPSSIDTICKLDEDTICTGSSDGIIRIISILPNKFEGIIGDHGEEFPIERIRLADNKKYMGSCAHDNCIHFWDVAHLFEEDDGEDEDSGEDVSADKDTTEDEVVSKADDEGDNHKDESDDNEDSDDSDDEESKKQKRKRGKKAEERAAKQPRKQVPSGFFDDL
ncbi:WD repeat-containing protein jip5 [Umbelopsis sp. WA50703]